MKQEPWHLVLKFFCGKTCSVKEQRPLLCSAGVGLMSFRQKLDDLVPKLSCLELESSGHLWRPKNAQDSRKGQQLEILSK